MPFEPSNIHHLAGLERQSIGAKTILTSYPPHTSSYGNPLIAAAIQGATVIAGGVIGVIQSNKLNKLNQQMMTDQMNAEQLLNQTNAQIADAQGRATAALAQQQMVLYAMAGVGFLGVLGVVAYYIHTKND